MIDYSTLAKCWRSLALEHWATTIEALSRSRLSSAAHGDFDRWRGVIESLENAQSDPAKLEDALLGLCPWRKGPFELGGIRIDSEWWFPMLLLVHEVLPMFLIQESMLFFPATKTIF